MTTPTNTERSFRDKWQKNRGLVFAETLNPESDIHRWILTRNGFQTTEDFARYLRGRRRMLDAGCGNGRVTALLRSLTDPATTEVVGFDKVSASMARENLPNAENLSIHDGDLLGDVSFLGTFDFIYCQEVIHHTSDPARAFANLCTLLAPGGEIAIYVYKKKAPVREFVDDYVREKIADLPYEQALQACDQITELGKVLSGLNVKFHAPRVDVLEIPEGDYDLQRFMYFFFMKCFWNPDLSFKDNSVINYDWYHPQLCFRHTMTEVQGWFEKAGLKILHATEDFYGITVRGAALCV
jgi:SAM-dependent methyltransferase